MATYYVRPDGNNANAGTGPATNQAWATVVYALANMTLSAGVNTLYIAPGTYRGSVTMSITPSVSNTLVVAGDPTAAQFTGVTAGRVRITTFTTDNTGTPTSSQTLTCDNKTYFTLRNLHIEGYQTSSGQGIAHFLNSKNFTVEKCLFTLYRRGNSSSCVFVTTTTTTAVNATFDKCVIVNGYGALNIQSPSTGSTFDLAISVKDTTVTLANNAVIVSNPSEGVGVGNGVTFYNCILHAIATIYLRSTNTTNKSSFYNNAICGFAGIGLDVSANTAVEDYNRFSCATDRSGTITVGTNSQSGVFGVDFDYSRITGLYALDFWASYNGSIAQNTGTLSGAPSFDIFGDAWSSVNPDVGAATFKIASSVGAYNPTERNASVITIPPDTTSRAVYVYLGSTGLTFSTTGLAAFYTRGKAAPVAITLVTQTVTGAYASGGFVEVSSTNQPGIYRLDLPNAALVDGVDDVTVTVRGAAGTNGAVLTISLVAEVPQASIVRMGPYEVKADGLGSSDPLDINLNAAQGIDTQVVDANGSGIDITSATLTVKVYNSGASLVATYTGTATYAADGRLTFGITTAVTGTAGTYTATITRSTSASDTQIFGPLRIYVRDI